MSTVPENANAGCPGVADDKAGQVDACSGCPNQTLCASGAGKQVDPAIEMVAERLSEVKHIVLVLSGKGGVGKSTFSSQFAFTLAAAGRSVGLLDVDICGPSIPRMLGLMGQKVHQSATGWSPVWLNENLGVMSIGFMLPEDDDAIIWRGPRKSGLIKQFLGDVAWGALDYLIIDTPPGTSDEHISIVQFLKECTNLAGSVIVTTPQEVSMADVRKELNFCVKTNVPVLGVVENMSGFLCPCCDTITHIFPHSGAGPKGMADRFNVPYLGALPLDPLLLSSCEAGKAYVTTHPKARGVTPLINVVRSVVKALEGPDAELDDIPGVDMHASPPEVKNYGEAHNHAAKKSADAADNEGNAEKDVKEGGEDAKPEETEQVKTPAKSE